MIRYALACAGGHEFEGWFSNSGDYDAQSERGLLTCPVCDSRAVSKQIMAPAVAGTKRSVDRPAAQAVMMEAMGRLRAHVHANFENVGDRFADEARAIHDGRSEERGIFGEATPQQVRELVDDGVPVAPLPPEAPKKTDLN
ncbi:MAG TPA: DUF1178 family protein [Caulobacteraceae bacterium]|jgi:hypothetical protein|nr:DUF1178 family protein [Caulobacteraceae bacterium]